MIKGRNQIPVENLIFIKSKPGLSCKKAFIKEICGDKKDKFGFGIPQSDYFLLTGYGCNSCNYFKFTN